MSRPIRMTAQRLAVLVFIVGYHAEHKFSPAQREICDHVDSKRPFHSLRKMSTSTAKYQIDCLIKADYLTGEPRIARGYAPTAEGIQYVKEAQDASPVR